VRWCGVFLKFFISFGDSDYFFGYPASFVFCLEVFLLWIFQKVFVLFVVIHLSLLNCIILILVLFVGVA
jgi:hypothetical protein